MKRPKWGNRNDIGNDNDSLLTRNVVFTGDASSLNTSYGGHLMIRKAAIAKIRGVEFTRFGQRGLMGR